MALFVKSIGDIVTGFSGNTFVTAEIRPEHSAYLGPEPYVNIDVRRQGVYDFANAVEPELEATWTAFEQAYQKDSRLFEFWSIDVDDVIVHPPYGIVSIGDTIVAETVRDSKMLAATFPGIDPPMARRAIKDSNYALPIELPAAEIVLDEHCFQLGWGLSENYFNWTLRYQSKIAVYQRGGRDLPLLVPADTHPFINNGLEFFGIRQSAVRYLNGRTRVRRLTLTAPSAYGRYQLTPMLPTALRDHPAVSSLWHKPPRAIYIPRGKAKMRRVTNEAEVIAHLTRRGCEVFDGGAHTIGEQIRAFRDATMVIAPHGAGLTNIVYSAPGTPVIEIVPEGYDQGVTSYRSLSDMFALDYVQMFALEEVPDRKGNRCNSDISISIDHLEQILEDMS